jgi:hypothetical protein
MTDYPPRSWLHPAIAVRPSAIEGRGLFATQPLAAGTVVQRIGGRVIDDDALARLVAAGEPYSTTAVGGGHHLLQTPDDPLRFGNHSCDPNLWMLDATTVAARRDIAASEELTTDYAFFTTEPAWRMPCRCGSRTCRGIVTGDDWRLPALRAAYAGHFSPHVAALIARGG